MLRRERGLPMNAEEIRELLNKRLNGDVTKYTTSEAIQAAYSRYSVTFLAEIAAQLADINQNIKLLAPSNEEIQHRAVELDIAEDERIKTQRAAHEALVNAPVSDPEKFTRCDWCAKEVPRPDGCAVGKTITCSDCVPF
jgi:hypothetical protein